MPITIDFWHMGLASLLVAASIFISWRMQLGLGRDMAWGAVRTFAQLTLTGYVLLWVIQRSQVGQWYWTLLALAVMVGVAVQTGAGRTKERVPDKLWVFAVAIASGGLIVLAFVIGLVLHVRPWFDAQYVLPLAGMIIGNAMTAGALAVSRFAADLRARRTEIESALALGATPAQASHAIRRDAVRAATIPSVNSMLVVGIVSLPGMMTGQIIAGQDPTQAVHYQVVVMYMITAAATFTSVVGVEAALQRSFTNAMQLRVPEQV